MAEWNERKEAFCKEYIIDFNGTQSAIRAGYSEKTAGAIASRLLKDVNIQAKIRENIERRAERTEITADRVIQEFAKIAFFNVKDVITWGDGGSYVRLKPMEQVDGTLISEVKNTENGLSIKFHDKMRALEALAKHTGVYDERPTTVVNIDGYKNALWERANAGDVWDGFDNGGPDPGGDDDGKD
jgi:phage terminase small subunit